jgi:uncharacterized membrane protein YbhN (UPF0104 family)
VRLSWRVLRWGLTLGVLAVIVRYFILPQLRRTQLSLLGHLGAGWLVTGTLLAGASLLCYSLLTRSLLPPRSLTLSTVIRIDLACTALCHSVPAGSTASAALGYRLFTSRGVKPRDMCFVLACQGPGASVVLNVLLWGALAAALPVTGFQPAYLAAGIAGAAGLMLACGLCVLLAGDGKRAVRLVRAAAARIPRLSAGDAERPVRAFAASARSFCRDRRRARRALLWAAAYWLLQAGSLWCFAASLGRYLDPAVLFAAFGAASVAAALPLTPAGLGVVEVTLPLLLTAGGITAGTAMAAVLGWRLVSYWLPILAGGIAYASLHLLPGGPATARDRAGRGLAAPGTTLIAGPAPIGVPGE